MKKLFIFVFLTISLSLFAGLDVDIQFDQDVVGESGLEIYTSEYFNITNIGDTADYTITLNMLEYPEGWFMTFCHDDLSNVGLSVGCHHYTQPWNFTFPADAVLAIDFQINNMGGNSGMVTFQYVITGGDLTEAIVLDFTFRTADFVSNQDNEVASPVLNINNYPNPFNPETTINYSLKSSGQVEIDIYNLLGQHITSLVNDFKSAGNHSIVWDGKDDQGRSLASGIFFYRIKSGKYSSSKKMILMK